MLKQTFQSWCQSGEAYGINWDGSRFYPFMSHYEHRKNNDRAATLEKHSNVDVSCFRIPPDPALFRVSVFQVTRTAAVGENSTLRPLLRLLSCHLLCHIKHSVRVQAAFPGNGPAFLRGAVMQCCPYVAQIKAQQKQRKRGRQNRRSSQPTHK